MDLGITVILSREPRFAEPNAVGFLAESSYYRLTLISSTKWTRTINNNKCYVSSFSRHHSIFHRTTKRFKTIRIILGLRVAYYAHSKVSLVDMDGSINMVEGPIVPHYVCRPQRSKNLSYDALLEEFALIEFC